MCSRFFAFLIALPPMFAPINCPAQLVQVAPKLEKQIDWRALAIADVGAAYKETKDNHPGMFDKTNLSFPKLLDQARVEALKLAQKTKSAGGYAASLARFRAVIDDGHAGAYSDIPETLSAPIRWPGFVAAWRGDNMYVYKSTAVGIVDGAKIVSCDKTPIRTLIERNVFQFRTGRKTPGNWWSDARRVFVDDDNPFITLPKSCVFNANGKAVTKTLSWGPIPDTYQTLKNGSANGDLLPIGMTEKAPGLFWFAMPDFQPDDAGSEAYKKMYADTVANRDTLLKARAIVLDLRFNQGGSSNWSKMLAENLWGEGRVTRSLKDYFAKTQTWWRPTPGNMAAIEEFIPLLEKQDDPDSAAMVKMFVPVFAAAVRRGDKYLVEPDIPDGMMPKAAADPEELKTPVYVIVSGQCASACLDAIDYFKRFSNTKLIGAPSSADSTYMEVRSAQLPSGMGRAIIPMKMYVDRPRGNGVFYTPDILMDSFDWSTTAFQKRIEADLAKK
jgi:Peptidase family S41